jgi:hypothetical protein
MQVNRCWLQDRCERQRETQQNSVSQQDLLWMDAVSFHPSLIALQQIQGCSDATTASIPHAMLLPAATKFSTIGVSIWS